MIAQRMKNSAQVLEVMASEGSMMGGFELRGLASAILDWAERVAVLEAQPVPQELRGGAQVVPFKPAPRATLRVVGGGAA